MIILNFQVKELNLDNARATQIEGLTDEYTNLETLSLINVGLTTFKDFLKLPKLEKIQVQLLLSLIFSSFGNLGKPLSVGRPTLIRLSVSKCAYSSIRPLIFVAQINKVIFRFLNKKIIFIFRSKS